MNKSVRGLLLGSLGCGLWGFSSVCIQYLTSTYAVNQTWLGCVRILYAGIIFLVASMIFDRKNLLGLLRDKKALGITVLYALVGMALYQIVYVAAIDSAGAASDSLIAQTGLIYVMFFTCWKNSRLPRRHEVICVVLAFLGVFFVSTKGNPSTLVIGLIPLLWCLADGVLIALHNLIPLSTFHRYGTLSVNAVALFLGGIMLMPFAHPFTGAPTLGADGMLALGATIIFGACLGYVFASQGLKDAGAILGTFANVVEPVSALVFSILLLGTSITLADVIGCICIAAMMIYLGLGEQHAKARVRPTKDHA